MKLKLMDMKRKSLAAVLLALVVSSAQMPAAPVFRSAEYKDAVRLYEKGMYDRARAVFDALSEKEDDPMCAGYALLCATRLKAAGYEDRMEEYFKQYGLTPLANELNWQYATNLFDEQRYVDAMTRFDKVNLASFPKSQKTELLFKRAYCDYALGDYESAKDRFETVAGHKTSEYAAPAQYALGYMAYADYDFHAAMPYFEKASEDPRFKQQALYYMLECKFMDKDYSYVARYGDDMYESVPEERKAHLARILSESYLVMGNAGKAKKYYEVISGDMATLNTADAFYAGSLQYTLGDYKKAVENFTQMGERNDSIGQIASYQLGYSYIQLRNKVAAMDAFKEASVLDYDAKIKEDALFNHAKLAFDLNHDAAPFKEYLSSYKESGKNDQIYDYIAVASLFNGDYAGAIEAYDNIESLTPAMRSNYMKANYLRAEQLIGNGSYRDAIPCLKAATFFASRQDNLNKLSRYWMAESYYKTGNYAEAQNLFTDLYNQSALDNKSEGRVLTYNLGYSFFDEGNYGAAASWFDKYIASGDKTVREDAMVRRADCDFLRKDYKAAVDSYSGVTREFKDPDDVYPYYQLGRTYGLLDKKKEKISALSKVLGATPDVPFYAEALYELGRTYVAEDNEKSAVKAFETLIRQSSDSIYLAKSLIELGMIERNKSAYDKALGYYKTVAEKFKGSESAEVAMLAIESIYQSQGEPEKYLAYTEALGKPAKSDDEKEAIYFNSAEQIFMTENYEKALVALDKYLDAYPDGSRLVQAMYYKAECFRALGSKEKACDCYAAVIDSPAAAQFKELALLRFSDLSYGMEHYKEAYGAYGQLMDVAQIPESRIAARTGLMRSAFKARDYAGALDAAGTLSADPSMSSDLRREAEYVSAKSLLAMSRRDEAFVLLRKLAGQPKTDEGAEASYMLIQDTFDQGRFGDVEQAVYKFADAAPDQSYWLAKSFIVLGDSFVENENLRQAKATFESILNGYEPANGSSDDVTENVRVRMEKLNEIMNM